MIELVKLKPGEQGFVAELKTNDGNILRKLMSMGILPGMPLQLIQAFPSYVLLVGYTQIALDKEIASTIFVNLRE